MKKQEKKKLFKYTNINLGYNKININTIVHNTLNKYIIGKKNNTFILNNNITQTYLIKALFFLYYILKSKGKIYIINTNPFLSKYTYILKKKLLHNNINFIDTHYTNGNLTNYKKIFLAIKTFIHFYGKYNEFLNANKIYFPSVKKMKNNYKGFIPHSKTKYVSMQKLKFNAKFDTHKVKSKVSSARKHFFFNLTNYLQASPNLIIFISNVNISSIVDEAFYLNIPTIGFVEKNTNIEKITYPIINNNYHYYVYNFFFKIFYKILRVFNI